jgi:transporter family protein
MWVLYAFLAAFTAALVTILAKLGLQNVEPTLATTLRSLIMALFLVLLSILLGKFNGFSISTSLNGKEWALLTLAGIADALSWLFYFFALKQGSASAVVVIDRLSLVFVIILAALLALVTAAHFWTQISKTTIFWAAFILTRPLAVALLVIFSTKRSVQLV